MSRNLTRTMIAVLVLWTSPVVAGDPLEEAIGALNAGRMDTALRDLRRLAGEGTSAAMAVLGDIHYFGWGVERSVSKAAGWYARAAALDDPGGHFGLGRLYLFAEGVDKDVEAAVDRFTRAGEAGFMDLEAETYGALCIPRRPLARTERDLAAFLRHMPALRPGTYLHIRALRAAFPCK